MQLQPGGALRNSPHFECTREFPTVQRRRIRVESGGDVEEPGAGDSANYRADVRHAMVNVGRSEPTMCLVEIYR